MIQIFRVLALRIVRREFDLNASDVDVGIVYHKEAVSPFAYCFDGLKFSPTTCNPRAHLRAGCQVPSESLGDSLPLSGGLEFIVYVVLLW